MALLNYTTGIDAWQTVSEIQQLLAKAGATHFSIKTDPLGCPGAVSFTIDFNKRPLNYLLPCNVQALKKFFSTDKETRERLVKAGKMKDSNILEKHAYNVGWRIIKDWIESQVALIKVEMATFHEVFLPHLIINAEGDTLSKKMLYGNGLKLLSL